MFGLFSKKNPPASLQAELVRQADQNAQAFFYISSKGHIPPSPDFQHDPVKCDSQLDREKLIASINETIEVHNLLAKDSASQIEAINSMARSIATNGAKNKYQDASSFLLAMLSSIDKISKTYYKDFPESKDLFEMVNQLAKIVSPGLESIFGNEYPSTLRQLYTHVSSLLESWKANRNF